MLTIEVDRILVGIDTQTNLVDSAKAKVGVEGTTQESHTCCKVNPFEAPIVPPNPAKAVDSMPAPRAPRDLPSEVPSTAPPSAGAGTSAGPNLTAVLGASGELRVSGGLSASHGPNTFAKPSAIHNAKATPSPAQIVLTRTGLDGKASSITPSRGQIVLTRAGLDGEAGIIPPEGQFVITRQGPDGIARIVPSPGQIVLTRKGHDGKASINIGELKTKTPSSGTVKNSPRGDEASKPEHEKAMGEATERKPIGASKSPGKNNKGRLGACTRPRKTLPRQVTTVDPVKKTADPSTAAGSSVTSSSGPSISAAAVDPKPPVSSADARAGPKIPIPRAIADTDPKKSAPSTDADINTEINTTTTTKTPPPPPATKLRKPRHRNRKPKLSVEHTKSSSSAAPAHNAATTTTTTEPIPPTVESKTAKTEKKAMKQQEEEFEAESEAESETPSSSATHAPFCMIDKLSEEYLCGSF